MANTRHTTDVERDGDTSVIRESTRGGQEPPMHQNDRPDQNVAYDEAVKGAPLTDEERLRAEGESPLGKPEGRRE